MNTFWVHKNWKWRKENATAKYIDEHCEEAVTLTDAQATVEALQADKLMLERGVSAQSALIDGLQSQLIQCTADLEALQRENECKDTLIETLQAQLRQVEGERDQWIAANTKEPINEPVTYQALAGARFVAKRAFDELVKARSDLSALRQLVEVHTKQLTELTIIPIGCSREQELRWTQSIKDLRAALAAQDAPHPTEERS